MPESLYRRRFLGVVGIGLCSAVGGCLGASDSSEATTPDADRLTTVSIREGEFSPRSLDAATGQETTLVFKNTDDREHVLGGDFAGFEVRVPAGETVSRTVTIPEKPDTYTVECDGEGVLDVEAVPEDVMGGCSLADE
mgnify:CR=1 FL=1